MNTQLISVDELRRNFGAIKKQLSSVEFIITDRGRPIAQLTTPRETRLEMMEKMFGAWKGTDLDDDNLWKDVLKRNSRKKPIKL